MRAYSIGFQLLLCMICVPAYAAEPTPQPNVPFVAPASDEGEMAIAQFRVPTGFKVELFAAEPRVSNPVAFYIDEHNRFFLVETYRRKIAVVDIRQQMDWLDEDTASRTVGARIAMVKKHRDAAGVAAMMKDSERVKLIEDRDGDGKADFDTVFATGFNRLEDGIAAGVLARGGDVYFGDIPSLWRLRDTNNDGVADVRDELHYGYGVRYNFNGHDLHGLRFGPDGKLYFSVGDRGLHVEKTPDGRVVSNPDSGAVLRCNADGTELELFHTGLRNPQDLAFDEFGNLFTGDNNSDAGDKARWVYVVEGGDSGWRIGYQNQEFPETRGPWNHEGLWKTSPPFPAAYILPPIIELDASGPSGLTYDPGTGLPPEFAGRFFLADFRGGPALSSVQAIKLASKGASFEVTEQKPIIGNLLCTDVEIGYDGLYISDWTNGWLTTGKGRLYRLYHEQAIKNPLVAETRKLMDEGMGKRPPEELAKLLAYADQRVRQAAQFELAGRGRDSLKIFEKIAGDKTADRLSRLHAIWGIGQVARQDLKPDVLKSVVELMHDQDDEVRAQAAKVLSDQRGDFPIGREACVSGMSDASPRVRFFSAMAVGKHGRAQAATAVIAFIRENNDADPYLRHAGVTALARLKNLEAIQLAAKDTSRAVRMAALLALRRMESPDVARFLTDPEPDLVLEAARAINDVPIELAMPQLAAMIGRKGLSDPVLTRVLNANYRAGTAEGAAALAAFAKQPDGSEAYRAEALRMLGVWENVPGRDRVTGNWRPLPKRDAKIAKDAAAPVLPEILRTAPNAVRVVAAGLVTKMGIADPALLAELAGDAKLGADVRAAAIAALAEGGDARLAPAVEAALKENDERIRAAGVRALGKLPGGVRRLAGIVYTGSPREKQAALATLAALPGDEVDKLFSDLLTHMISGDSADRVIPEIRLDVLDAAAARKSTPVAEKLQQYESKRDPADPIAAFREVLAGGDVRAGEQIFRDRADVSCLRCHAIKKKGGNAGPDLAGIALRHDRAYMLESILFPGKVISPGFETVIVRLKDGSTYAGQVREENAKMLHLVEPGKTDVRLDKSKIKARRGGMSSMPDNLASTLSKQDLRNLVEFLASLNQDPPKSKKKKAEADLADGVSPAN